MTLRERHANRVGEALTKRSGSHFNARRVPNLWVTGRRGFPLAELLQIFELEPVAGEEQQ